MAVILNRARIKAAQKRKEILNLAEAAAFLGCNPQTLRRQVKKGAVPCFKAGRFIRFNRNALERLTMGETFGAGSVQTENERNLEQ